MLKLNSELGLPQPTIIDKPFSSLSSMLDNIVDIDDKDHFKGVKERLEIVKKQVREAIQQFELAKIEPSEELEASTKIDLFKKSIIDLFKKSIIDLMVEGNYQEEKVNKVVLEAQVLNNSVINVLLSELFLDWGNNFGNLAESKSGKESETFYQQAIKKYQKSIETKPDKYEPNYNWGTVLGILAKTKSGPKAEALYQQAFEKFQKAIEIKPDKYETYYNWGNYLGNFAKIQFGQEAETLYQQAFEKFQKAIEIKPDHVAYANWGTGLGNLAKTKSGQEAETLFQQAIEKHNKAIELGAGSYNLACIYALKSDKENALLNLAKSLENNDLKAEFVVNDEDWGSYQNDEDFKTIINDYLPV